jgi:hypothetical protein
MRSLATVILAFVGVAGCIPAVPDGGPEARPTNNNPTPSPTPSPNPSPSPTPQSCGAQTFALNASTIPPNVFFVVDRSGSMSDNFGGVTSGTKWDAAQTALNNLLNTNRSKAQWGLSLFPPNPSVNTCGKAQIDVQVGPATEDMVLSKINALTNFILDNPRGETPTADAMKTARDSASLSATDRNNYVVLITDGIPKCNSAADVGPVIDALYNRSPSVKTFVVGIGAETASNPTLLNQWAEKGHTARANAATKYYQANDGGALVSAFDAIVGATSSCAYKLDSPPPDPNLVVGKFDGVELAKDAANGFTYDTPSQSVIFHGAACDKLQAKQVSKVDVVYGCPPQQVL